jgi:hypothetical protein
MKKIFINLNQNTAGIKGWTASISVARMRKGAKTAVATGESELYTTKQQAWASIKKRAEGLDYVNNEVSFNYAAVTSYQDVEACVAAL